MTTPLEEAKAVLADFERVMDEDYPYLLGNAFARCSGLDQHVLAALQEFVRLREVEENAKPAKRVNLTEV